MRSSNAYSLKSVNMKWLVLLISADALMLTFCVAPETIDSMVSIQAVFGRVLVAIAAPVAVLLLVDVLPHSLKAMFVYWKLSDMLPGTRAFTKYGPTDPRINMIRLKENIGSLPSEPREQNSLWYKLYKQVSDDPSVMDSHRKFLMYRDMAVISLVLLIISLVAFSIVQTKFPMPWFAVFLFFIQYVATALSARWSGIRLICNVLAIHSSRKVLV